MLMTYLQPSPSQQQPLVSFTRSDAPSKLTLESEQAGPTLIDNNRKGDIYESMVCTEAMLRGANVYKNCSKVGKTDLIIEYKGKCLSVDVKASSCHKSSAPGVALVHVDVESHKVRWARPTKAPLGWESFWND